MCPEDTCLGWAASWDASNDLDPADESPAHVPAACAAVAVLAGQLKLMMTSLQEPQCSGCHSSQLSRLLLYSLPSLHVQAVGSRYPGIASMKAGTHLTRNTYKEHKSPSHLNKTHITIVGNQKAGK